MQHAVGHMKRFFSHLPEKRLAARPAGGPSGGELLPDQIRQKSERMDLSGGGRIPAPCRQLKGSGRSRKGSGKAKERQWKGQGSGLPHVVLCLATAIMSLQLAAGETVILLHPPLPLLDVSIGMKRGCQ